MIARPVRPSFKAVPPLLIVIVALLASGAVAMAGTIGACATHEKTPTGVLFHCDGADVRVDAIAAGILRVRAAADGRFPEALPNQLGLVRESWPAVEFSVRDKDGAVQLEAEDLRVRFATQPFAFALLDPDGKPLLEQAEPLGLEAGWSLALKLAPDDHFYGLGFQRTSLDLRGKRLDWDRRYRDVEATVPFFMSTRGYGFYSNNTWKHTFNFSEHQPGGRYSISATGGALDFYLFYGPRLGRILDRYTDLTGKPLMAPRFSLGLAYICRYFTSQKELLDLAARFRHEDIPLDIMGLEPGWEEHPYSNSWTWSKERFPDPAGMIRDLGAHGVKLELWESGSAPQSGYINLEARRQWYKQRVEATLGKGVRFFKQDDPYPRSISSQELQDAKPSNELGGSGTHSAAELKNITNSVFSQTVFDEYLRLTNERALELFNGYGSSVASQRWPLTWGGDFTIGSGLLNAGLSGHSMVSVDMNNETPAGIHNGYLLPYSLIDSWAFYQEPWLYSEPLLEMNRRYAQLRSTLSPYLYTTLHQSAASGMPMMRAMVLENQDDPELRNLVAQYMLGDWLLVGQTGSVDFNDEVGDKVSATDTVSTKNSGQERIYLPAGLWFDYWTGQAVQSKGEWVMAHWGHRAGGPLYVKGGAIIPMGSVAQHIDQNPLEVVRLDIYPAASSKYTLYEDDGNTYDYLKGAFAVTEFQSEQTEEHIRVLGGSRKGTYATMPARREYLLSIHAAHCPRRVLSAGLALPQQSDAEKLLNGGRSGWRFDAENHILWVKPSSGWSYRREAVKENGDPGHDYVVWDKDRPTGDGTLDLQVVLDPHRAAERPVALKLVTEQHLLLADGASRAKVLAVLVDKDGAAVEHGGGQVSFSLSGGGQLQNGSNRCTLPTRDGSVEIEVVAPQGPGRLSIRAEAEGMKPAVVAIVAVPGVFELKASPPERVNLEDGSWLTYAITVYATVRFNNQIVTGANGVARLQFERDSGTALSDRTVQIVDGVATFKDIIFKNLPHSLFHVEAKGVKPVQMQVY
jgi:alpha-glucosidase (family GH31 glycosyl hydrolase)